MNARRTTRITAAITTNTITTIRTVGTDFSFCDAEESSGPMGVDCGAVVGGGWEEEEKEEQGVWDCVVVADWAEEEGIVNVGFVDTGTSETESWEVGGAAVVAAEVWVAVVRVFEAVLVLVDEVESVDEVWGAVVGGVVVVAGGVVVAVGVVGATVEVGGTVVVDAAAHVVVWSIIRNFHSST